MNDFMRLGQRFYLPIKACLDFFFSLLFIIFLFPFYFIIFVIVIFDTKAFPIFRQKRVGKNGKYFLLLKFRSMKKNAPQNIPTNQFENPSLYITRFGSFLRRTSIDELPQLFNILIGQMSFIGPRPALWNQEEIIELRKNTGVCVLKPGLSGYAQCYGRDKNSNERKVELDDYYFRNFSLILDIKLFFKSILNALMHKDVIEGKQA